MIRLKTKDEINILREGGKRHAEILLNLKKIIKPGLVTSELDKRTRALVAEKGDEAAFLNYRPEGNKTPYPSSICVSINDEIVHGIPSGQKIIKEGDIVSIDLGLKHKGLITDSAISVVVGEGSKEALNLVSKTKEALSLAIKKIKPGRTIGDISFAIESFGRKNNFGIPKELAGHGVGYAVHEDPYVPNLGKPKTGEQLVPGMVLAIEPMFFVGGDDIIFESDEYTAKTADGSLSAHFEHTVVVTDGGFEILTN